MKEPTEYDLQCQRAAHARNVHIQRAASQIRIVRRFWSQIQKGDPSECWPWIGARSTNGYGIFKVGPKVFVSSRFAWELAIGPIPEGLLICHHCDNPPCCNPNHLFTGTHKENAQDCIQKGRKPILSGEKHPLAKLTASQVVEARKLHALGLILTRMAKCFSFAALGKRYGVSDVAVQCAVTRVTWTHIK